MRLMKIWKVRANKMKFANSYLNFVLYFFIVGMTLALFYSASLTQSGIYALLFIMGGCGLIAFLIEYIVNQIAERTKELIQTQKEKDTEQIQQKDPNI